MRTHRLALSCLFGAFILLTACAPKPAPGTTTTTANSAPNAVIAASATAGPAPLVVSFSASGSTDPGGAITDYAWDFGDSTTSSDETVDHTYNTAGTYVVTLLVSDAQSLADSATVTITVGSVNSSPTAVASATPTSGKAPLSVSFSSATSSDPDGTIVDWAWDFGDSSTSTAANPSHTYASAGIYTATLTVTDDDGATATDTVQVTANPNQAPTADAGADTLLGRFPMAVSFTSSGSGDPDGSIASYAWDFGDSGTSTAANPSHTYASPGTYLAVLTVTDDNGATGSDSVSITVTPNQAPVAVADATPSAGQAPLAVSFSSASSTDGDGTIASYYWDFGDGNQSTSANPSHTFASDGTYNVALTVTDNDGATDSTTVQVVVDPIPNVPPTAAATATPSNLREDLPVSFDSSGSTDTDGSIVSRYWDFGDGTNSAAANPTKTYTNPGTFNVTLTVTDNAGGTDTDTVVVTVNPNQAPTAVASPASASGKEPLSVSFSSAGSGDADGSITSYYWDFGDGFTSTAADPAHTYATPGSYSASLTVTDDLGATGSDSASITVLVNPPPVAAINASPQTGPEDLAVNFDSSSSSDDGSIVSRGWDFGDGFTSSATSPTHTYTADGTYNATLTVTDDGGKTDTSSVTITVTVDVDDDNVSPPSDCNDADNTIYPGAPDAVGDSIDQNCDGVDGTATATKFVSGSGSDTGSCGTPAGPCATINQGIARAVADGVSAVHVASGSYAAFTAGNGISVRGGFASNFVTSSGTTTVNGAWNGTAGVSAAIVADNLSSATTIAKLTAVGANESANARASFGIVVRNSGSSLSLNTVSVVGGIGGNGSAGSGGASATQTAASAGNTGQNSEEKTVACSTSRKSGGAAVGSGTRAGGKGGDGGSQDSTCPCVFGSCWDSTAGVGGNGGGGGAAGGSGGARAGSGNAGNGTGGAAGSTGDGAGGSAGAASLGTVSGGTWQPSGGNGGSGSLGADGTGGGGGGGGGASDESTDDMGAGGGGGGQGGSRASAAGTGGTPGHASVAVFLVNSTVSFNSVTVTLGNGGNGGAGGSGGLGQPGGAGGAGGMAHCNNNTGYSGYPYGTCSTGGNGGGGGNGGAGGRGGHAGAGGGGAGGPAIGIARSSSTVTGSPSYTGGVGGSGGAGGGTGVAGSAGQSGSVTNLATI